MQKFLFFLVILVIPGLLEAITLPVEISGLQAWWDATDVQSMTLTGQEVTQWRSKVGNAVANAPNSSSQPTLVESSHPVSQNNSVTFTSDRLNISDPTSPAAMSNLTVFMTFNFRGGAYPLGLGDGSAPGRNFTTETRNGASGNTENRLDIATGWYQDGTATLNGISSYTTGWRTWAYRGAGTVGSIQVWQNGVAATMSYYNSPGTGLAITMQGYMSETADFGEILIFNRALSNTEVSDVNQYLNDKWFTNSTSSAIPEPSSLIMSCIFLLLFSFKFKKK